MQCPGGSDPVLFPAAPEGGRIDTQDVGCLLQGFRRGQDTPDMLLLDLFEADPVADGGCDPCREDVAGKVLDAAGIS